MKKDCSGRTRAGNSDKLSDTGRARAWAFWARAWLGPKFKARAAVLISLMNNFHHYLLTTFF